MPSRILRWAPLFLAALAASAGSKKQKTPPPLPVDVYVNEALSRPALAAPATAGSTWAAGGLFSDMARDPRASQIDDMVTILVVENASAVATGNTKTSRASSANSSIGKVLGMTKVTGPLANLANLSSERELSGDGTTSRTTTLSATMSARVTHVLPNGYLALEGVKNVMVNSENQLITVRGVARPADISRGNVVRSDRLAQLDVRINGKGVVNDAVRRPHFLYRLLLGLLPF
jgi:flagellar L-ring protein precursor FlgH